MTSAAHTLRLRPVRRVRAGNVLGAAFSLLLVLALLVLAVPAMGIASGRWRFVPIRSGSMSPSFPTGSLAVATPVPLERLKIGDVLVYRIPVGDHRLIAHRIVRIVRGGAHPIVVTKGDANRSPDPWRARLDGSPGWIVGAKVPLLGYASIFARSFEPLVAALVLVVVGVPLALRVIWRRPERRPALGGDRSAGLQA